MNNKVFNVDSLNIIEDSNYYYLFRALNIADHNDFVNNLNNGNIRTDGERFEEKNSSFKYKNSKNISLEEIYDHIKENYSKETNCISLSINANISLNYGSEYFDEYILVRVPKSDLNNYYYAGYYMINEINNELESTIKNIEDNDIKKIINLINNCNNNEVLMSIIDIDNEEILSRFINKEYFNTQQQLEYNKMVAKMTVLEFNGIREKILVDNDSLLDTIDRAFTSEEVIHYGKIDKKDFIHISRNMVEILALIQQLKDKNIEEAKELEYRIVKTYFKDINRYNNNYIV